MYPAEKRRGTRQVAACRGLDGASPSRHTRDFGGTPVVRRRQPVQDGCRTSSSLAPLEQRDRDQHHRDFYQEVRVGETRKLNASKKSDRDRHGDAQVARAELGSEREPISGIVGDHCCRHPAGRGAADDERRGYGNRAQQAGEECLRIVQDDQQQHEPDTNKGQTLHRRAIPHRHISPVVPNQHADCDRSSQHQEEIG